MPSPHATTVTVTATASATPALDSSAPRRMPTPVLRRAALSWAFNLFNSVRVLAYVPTIHAIVAQGDSSQHSLWTWAVWVGANATMAAWVFEHNGHRWDKAVLASAANALACVVTLLVIVHFRGPAGLL